ncbi:MAG: MT-A70 family methyltransferase [Myxococcota bacterium]
MTFAIIYADPPWSYRDKAGPRGAEARYPCMPLERLQELDVAGLAAPSATLFMWTTWPMLQDALDLGADWGFEYVSAAFVWVKVTKHGKLHWGMGAAGTRANTEPCLQFRRGKPKRVSAGVHQVIMSPRREHSRKPDEARDRIVELMGDLPRVELFARQSTPGWDVWGNEVASTVELGVAA